MGPGAATAAGASSSTLYYLFENKFRSSCGTHTHTHRHACSPNALYICHSGVCSTSVWVCSGAYDVHTYISDLFLPLLMI